MGDNRANFVVCLRNEDFEASLTVGKLYRMLPDTKARSESLVRVVDETGEDYLYPDELFAPVEVTHEIATALS